MKRIAALVVSLFAVSALAESNRFNLHINPGVLISNAGVGPEIDLGFDWQFVRGIAVDVRVGTSFPINDFGLNLMFNPAAGMRFRLLDDVQGYANQPGGNSAGNLSIAPHVGALIGSVGAGFSIDVEAAYVFSVATPLQLGPYVRPLIGFGTFGVIGGVSVGLAMHIGIGPELGHDRDADGVGDERDKCPDTPAGSEVDARGCTIIPKAMVLDGITFKLNSAEIEPDSERTLQRALLGLRDNPEAQVEIGGHTDDTGTTERNETLSRERAQSVRQWLVSHGIDAGRLTAKGYGATKPKVKNADEASRTINRRIEFTRLDQ